MDLELKVLIQVDLGKNVSEGMKTDTNQNGRKKERTE